MSRPGPRTLPPPLDVLLVEDDDVLCALLTHALRERNLAVDVADDTVEAKRLLARNVYRVAVIDLFLRTGTGFEVIDFIRTVRVPTTHVIVVTAAEPSRLEQLDRSLAKTVFFKPFNVDHLAAYVAALSK